MVDIALFLITLIILVSGAALVFALLGALGDELCRPGPSEYEPKKIRRETWEQHEFDATLKERLKKDPLNGHD
ncbi:MAG TPA: hypothetical protein EYG51_14390, partial [Pseudomonadales bacterium]|nr:hypothetical protein [Pseudomonadales bacterium]